MNTRGPKPKERKIFVCTDCLTEFQVPYICITSKKVLKRCNKCNYNFKISQGFFDNKVDHDELYIKICNYLKNFDTAPTFETLLKELKISSLTFRKCTKVDNSSFTNLITKLGLKSKGRSKFQNSVYSILYLYYPDIIQEYRVLNKFIDFYIPSLNTAIECDGAHHIDADNYFNRLSVKHGYINSLESDVIKENYCKDNKITLIRIPYKKYITKKYIQKYINLNEPNTEG